MRPAAGAGADRAAERATCRPRRVCESAPRWPHLRDLDAEVDFGDRNPAELGLEPDEEGLHAAGNWMLHTRFGRLDVMQDVPGLRSYEALRAGATDVNGDLRRL